MSDCEWPVELLKALSAPAAVIIAGLLAWLTRRAERLKDAYAEWAAAVHEVGVALQTPRPETWLTPGGDWSSEWFQWKAARSTAFGRLRAARLLLFTREPDPRLREFVDHASNFTGEVDPAQRMKEVDALVSAIAPGSWLILVEREVSPPPKKT